MRGLLRSVDRNIVGGRGLFIPDVPAIGELHLLKSEDRNAAWDLGDASVSEAWELCDLSIANGGKCPLGTKAIFGFMRISYTGVLDRCIIWTREYGSIEGDYNKVITLQAYGESGGAGVAVGAPVLILAPDGKFEYRENATTHPVDTLEFELWGWTT